MQVGIKNLAIAQHGTFHRLRLLNLNDHIRRGKHLRCAVDYLSTSITVLSIAEINPHTGIGLNHNAMTMSHQFNNRSGRQTDAVLMIFNFLRNPYQHIKPLV